ncbi:hypothetical protein [Methylomonas sp. AM2-LC]|uniref:hypothetical protein n=1 Tax=Methylomonas sp. AM2-LC TaxID=3153301 RepID=UPI003263F1C9
MNKYSSILKAAIASAVLSIITSHANAACNLGGNVKHVVYIQFDNVHLERDRPNIPSDLEQMPNLLNFLQNQGTLLANHHTPLISHTANNIITSLTGIYGDKHGQPISNSYGYFKTNGSIGFSSSFSYWTDPSAEPNSSPIMVGQNGKVAPAPWVPFTRAGCDVGQVSVANTILENTTSDITTVFGATSPEAIEAASNSALAQADFVGIGVHCGFNSALCNNTNAKADKLRSEMDGYAGYKALFGHKYVAATISPSSPLLNLDGVAINDGKGNNGFPGFDGMSASNTLGYVAKMLESGIPVVYSYISDAHDNHVAGSAPCNVISSTATCAYGTGEAGYVAALKTNDTAFGKFFSRLAADGIDASNTLFIVTTDEQDHVAETLTPSPAGCDGITTPCVYNHTPNSATTRNVATVGEVNVNLSRLLNTEKGNTTPFSVHSDLAPTFYLTNNPAQNAASTRQLERDVADLTTYNPYKGITENMVDYIADQAGMSMIHMITSDSARTPNFVTFLKGDYFASASGTAVCTESNYTDCVNIQSGFAYNHGGYQPEITTTWLGLVGPGVNISNGVRDTTTWTDHTDIRPTLLNLVGLTDTYQHDGRVMIEILNDSVLPSSLASTNRNAFTQLAQAYKQINAPVGSLGLKTLAASTVALKGHDASDTTYSSCEAKISTWVQTRNNLASQMISALENAEFFGIPVDSTVATSLVNQANNLIANANCP